MEKTNYYDPFEFAEEDIDKVFRRGFGLETGMPQQEFQADVPEKVVKSPEKVDVPKSLSHMTKVKLASFIVIEYGLVLPMSMTKKDMLEKVKEVMDNGNSTDIDKGVTS